MTMLPDGAHYEGEWNQDNNIRHVTTLTHAPVAERQIRTIKSMIYQRVEKTNEKWHTVLGQVLLVYN